MRNGGITGIPLVDGAHTWYVTAEDDGGATVETARRSFIVDATAPTFSDITIDDPSTVAGYDLATANTIINILIGAKDNYALEELGVTFSKANMLFGAVTGYTVKENTAFTLSQNESQSIQYKPKTQLESGNTYRLSLLLTDSAGNTSTKLVTVHILSDQEESRKRVAELDSEKNSAGEIIETLRELLPDTHLSIPELTASALARRQAQGENFITFRNRLFGQFPVFASMLEYRLHELLADSKGAFDNLSDMLVGLTRSVNEFAVNYYDTNTSFFRPISELNKRWTFWTFLNQKVATMIESAQETRVKTGLKNRLAIQNSLNKLAAPVTKYITRTARFTRVAYEHILDNEPTKISDVRLTKIGHDSVVIEWNTNHLTSRGKVNYGTSGAYGQEYFLPNTLSDHHRAELTGLIPNTTYFFEVMNQNGDYVYDAYYSVTTLGEGEAEEAEQYIPQIATILQSKDDNNVPVYKEPKPEADVLQLVHPGETYRALVLQDGWVSILLPSQHQGWLLRESVELSDQTGVSAQAQPETRE